MTIRSYGLEAMLGLMRAADLQPRVKLLPETEQWLRDVAPPYFASEESPTTYDEVRDHWQRHKLFHVFSGGSTDTMFSCREVQYAYRAWHDSIHMEHEIDFSMDSELLVARLQEAIALRQGVDPYDARLLCLDLEAHIKYYYARGHHPVQQVALIRDVIMHGMDVINKPHRQYH